MRKSEASKMRLSLRDKLKWQHPLGKFVSIALWIIVVIELYLLAIGIDWINDWWKILVTTIILGFMGLLFMSALQRN